MFSFSVKPINMLIAELLQRQHEMDDHQLAALLTALEATHVNRLAEAAGYIEYEDVPV